MVINGNRFQLFLNRKVSRSKRVLTESFHNRNCESKFLWIERFLFRNRIRLFLTRNISQSKPVSAGAGSVRPEPEYRQWPPQCGEGDRCQDSAQVRPQHVSSYASILGDIWLWEGVPWALAAPLPAEWKSVEPTNPESITKVKNWQQDLSLWTRFVERIRHYRSGTTLGHKS